MLRDSLPDKDDILKRHLAANPKVSASRPYTYVPQTVIVLPLLALVRGPAHNNTLSHLPPDQSSTRTKQNKKKSMPIYDTAATHWQLPRQPSQRPMIPIGHIALDLRPEEDATLPAVPAPDEDEQGGNKNIVWVAGLFISYALQASGIGREAMRAAESIAAQKDLLDGGWIVLDTMQQEKQLSGALYVAMGRPVPKVASQDWYERQGYVVLATEKVCYKWVSPVTGEELDIEQVFLRKKLSR